VFCFEKTQALKFAKGLPQTREFPKSKHRCPVNSITDFFRFVKGGIKNFVDTINDFRPFKCTKQKAPFSFKTGAFLIIYKGLDN
jgi:hypothetical protein